MKNVLIGLTVISMIAVALFWQQVWAIFAGMTVLEALNTIVTFILHVVVATIAAYVVMLVPEYVKPWLKLFRRKQRQAWKGLRRGRPQQVEARVTMPRANKNEALVWMASQMAKNSPTPRSPQRSAKSAFGERADDEVQLRF